jgi:hypothetical protein
MLNALHIVIIIVTPRAKNRKGHTLRAGEEEASTDDGRRDAS